MKVNRNNTICMVVSNYELTGVAPIVFAIDTSGSTNEKYLRQSISELNTLIEEVAQAVTVIQCDYGVTYDGSFVRRYCRRSEHHRQWRNASSLCSTTSTNTRYHVNS